MCFNHGGTEAYDFALHIVAQMVDLYRAGAKLGQALAARRIAQQKLLEAARRKAQIQASIQTLDKIDLLGNAFPSPELQYQVANMALLSGATAVDRAGEYFFVLRRGVERDTVPADPATGKSLLAQAELKFIQGDPTCQNVGVTTESLDVNFTTLDCFDHRADNLAAIALAAKQSQQLNVLDLQDTTVPATSWQLVTDAQGVQSYVFNLDVSLQAAHRGFRATHRKQKIADIGFFIESSDPSPALIPIHVRRPETNKDVYWLGQAPVGTGGALQDVFQSFDVVRAVPLTPDDLLYYLLRDHGAYEHDAYACNGLNEFSPLPGNFKLCKLSELDPNLKAFVAGYSLIGRLEVRIPVAELESKSPGKLFANVSYHYETSSPF